MRRAALDSQSNLAVRQLAEASCASLDSKDYTSEYLALYNLVLQRCRYMRDPRTVELVRAPYLVASEILQGGRPNLDCDDMSALLGALVLAVGGAVRYVTVAFRNAFYNGERQYSHVFAQALEPRTGLWITLDPVAAEKTGEMMKRVRAAAIWPVA
jgi:Transglutaminase-like superfamily